MRIYYIVFIVALLIQFIPARSDKSYLRRVILTFIPMFLFGALRVDFGYDYASYENEFYLAKYFSQFEDISRHSETGYILFEKIIPTWRLFLIITSALTCLSIGAVIYKCVPPKYTWLAICFFFLAGDKTVFFQFSGIRNAIAIALMYLSFPLIRERKWISMIIITIVAMCFHTSAILFIPAAYLLGTSNEMSQKEAWIWIAAMMFLQVLSLNVLFEQATDIVGQYLDRYTYYMEKAEDMGEDRSLVIRGFTALFVILIVHFMRTTRLTKSENTICRISLLFIMSYLLGALTSRMPQWYGLAFVCCATIIVYKWKNMMPKYLFLIVTLAYLYYSFYVVFINRPTFPYQVYKSIFG